MKKSFKIITFLSVLACLFVGCTQAYFGALEKIGIPKRKLFVTRVQDAKSSQENAKEDFKDALTKFSEIVHVNGGDLEKRYSYLKKSYERAESSSETVKARIRGVRDVSNALFKEWEQELAQYSSDSLRRSSSRKLDETKRKYEDLDRAFERVEAKLDPALAPLKDQVLFLKHNLNAKAIASLEGEKINIEADVSRLVREIEESVKEAETFVAGFESEQS